MASANGPAQFANDAPNVQESDLSDLSTEPTDTFERHMAEQLRSKQLLRNAANGRPIFGRHSNNASLRSAMENLGRSAAGSNTRHADYQTSNPLEPDIDGQPVHSATQWGTKGSHGTGSMKQILSQNAGAGLQTADSGSGVSQRDMLQSDKSTAQGRDALDDIMRLERDNLVLQDSPASLRADRRRRYNPKRQNERDKAENLGLATTRLPQTGSDGLRKSRSLSYARRQTNPAAAEDQENTDRTRPIRDSKGLLKSLARAASASPKPGVVSGADWPDNADSKAATALKFGNPDADAPDVKQEPHPRGNDLPAYPQRQSIAVLNPTEEFVQDASKTPRVIGAWVDTPKAARVDGRSEADSANKNTALQNQHVKQPARSSLPRSAAEYLLRNAQAGDEALGDTTLNSLRDLAGQDLNVSRLQNLDDDTLELVGKAAEPLSKAEREQKKELVHLSEMAKRLHAARSSLRDASQAMKRIEHEIEGRSTEKDSSDGTSHIAQNIRLSTVVKNELRSLLRHFWAPTASERMRLTWVGVFALIALSWAVSEVTLW
ncbi:hypothetical protein FH972_022139 [Carpinus fangiana]|uniref:Uncharacterized protein n=1 Tax=Carpinus fangiana TaxID=176857 RepID=A0A5N6KRD2_9ROSI|nr:hypothetical protein FH972_022139 [Carpinus fangiana]